MSFLELARSHPVDRIYSVHYFEYGPDYTFVGESHAIFGNVIRRQGRDLRDGGRGGEAAQKGQMIFHKPGEFHNDAGHRRDAPNIVIVSFGARGDAMRFFEGRVVSASDNERC